MATVPYSVHYTPQNTLLPSFTIDELKNRGIRYIRLQWLDFTNTTRARIIPIAHFIKMLDAERPSVSLSKAIMGLVFLTVADGFGAIGDWLLIPDLSTLKPCPEFPGHANVLGWFQEKAPISGRPKELQYHTELCPRGLLKRILDDAKEQSGIEFLVGFEIEFILLKSTSPIVPVNEYGFYVSQGLGAGSLETTVLEEIVEALTEAHIEVQAYHVEAAPGQFEIVTGPLPPLQSADALVHTRHTIYNVANKHGLRATFSPRLFTHSCGNAAHAHISVHSSNPTQTSAISPHLNTAEAAFLSGVLTHLPSLAILILPTYASYQRVVDGVWSGGTYVCWGSENRESPMRLCNAGSPLNRNFELKALDGTANPHLALAGVLGAGAMGIKKGYELTIKDCGDVKTAAQMTEEERAAMGINARLPLNWEAAHAQFSQDQALKELLGEDFCQKYLAVNKTLGGLLTAPTRSAEAQQKLLMETY